MLRKMIKKAGALLVVGMTMVGMLGTGLTTVNAAANTFSVDVNNVEFDDKYVSDGVYENQYHIIDPIVHIPAKKTLTYMTINVRNAVFDTSAEYVQSAGTHHYNAGGSSSSAYADLIILNTDYKTETAIENILKNIVLHRSVSNEWNRDETTSTGTESIQIEVEISDNAVSIPSTYNYNYYKDITTGKTYLYLTYKDTSTAGVSWHEAYNAAKTIEFSNMKGYLAADTQDSSFNDHLSRTGGTGTADAYAGWVGITAIYNVTDSSTTLNSSTWKTNSDGDVWANTPAVGKYAAASNIETNKTATDSYTKTYYTNDSSNTGYLKSISDVNSVYWNYPTQYNGTANSRSSDDATNYLKYYYLADGPSTGTGTSYLAGWAREVNNIYLYSQTQHSSGSYIWYTYSSTNSYSLIHYSPDNLSTTAMSTSTLSRSDKTEKEDCAAFDAGALEDYSESVQKKAFYVEFTSDKNYTNAFMTGDNASYLSGVANTLYTASKDFTAESSKPCTFKTYLLMDDDASVPTQRFYYNVESVNVTNDTDVFTGIDDLTARGSIPVQIHTYEAYSYFSAATNSTTEYSAASQTDKDAINAAYPNTDFTGKKYAVSDATIDFTSRVAFHEPGIYRFKVTAVPQGERYIQYDPIENNSMYIDVYVNSVDGSETLQIVDYIFHTATTDIKWQSTDGTKTKADTKRPYFVNQYLTDTLTVTKNVSGNQSRLDQYFNFTLYIADAANGAKIKAEFTDASTTVTGGSNSSMAANGITTAVSSGITANGGYSTDNKFYLKANQSVTFKGVPKGIKYIVYEDKTQLNQTGYTPSVKSVVGDNNNTYDSEASTTNQLKWLDSSYESYVYDEGMTEDTTLVINNNKDGLVPTGIIVTVAPYAAVALCGFFGLFVFARHKKNEDEEEN